MSRWVAIAASVATLGFAAGCAQSSLRTGILWIGLAGLLSGCGAEHLNTARQTTTPPAGPAADQRAFFENLRALCGQTYGGRTILAPPTDQTFEPARLFMVVEECDGDEIRVPFIVGEDDSRTWVFRMGADGLTFFHEHLRPDGTAHDVSGFGGHATGEGSPTFQSFPDFWATEDTPPEEHRIWRLRIDRGNDLFVYYLDRGGQPAYRLVFYMGEPSPPLVR